MPSLLRIVFFISDLAFLNCSIAWSARFSGTGAGDVAYLLAFSNLTWLFLVLVSSPYNLNKGWSTPEIVRSQLAFISVHLLVVASLIYFFKREYSAAQICILYLFFVPPFFLTKVITYYLRKVLTTGPNVKNYVILGRNPQGYEVRKYYASNPELGFRFKGYLDVDNILNDASIMRDFCVRNDVHEILCCLPNVEKEELTDVIKFGLDSLIKIRIITQRNRSIEGIRFESTKVNEIKDTLVLPLDDANNQLLKRVFDILFSATFLIAVMSWLMPIIAVLIRLDSRGPIFFKQARSGRGNQPFICLKFRTMVVNRDSDIAQASRNDPRVTRIGGFLRKTSIDELPQFINVLVGNMSVVGPRPHMLRHTEEYSKLIDEFMARHYVKPGITGLAQCMGYRGETKTLDDMINRVRLDRHYIENWSFWFDMKIIVLTVISLIRGSDKAF